MSVERVISIRKTPGGPGQQYEVKWQGQNETTWEAASRVRRQIPHLVQAFEQSLQQQQQDSPMADGDANVDAEDEGAEGAAMADVVPARGPSLAADGSSMRAQLEAMQQLLREQAQQLQQLRSSPAHSPQQSPRGSPNVAAAAAAAAVAPLVARRKEPRLSDLAEYNGASGDKLDTWLAELRRCARYYQLSGTEAVEFAAARLRDSADVWWATLSVKAQTDICSVETLTAALRERFQPVTTARVAREKLHALQQGNIRHIDDYIMEFSKLHAQVPDMAEPDARAQFVRGLRRDLASKLEDADWENMPLATVIAKAARIGGRAAAAQPPAAKASVNQMDIDDSSADGMEDRIARSVLNALQSQSNGAAGLGAKTQTQRGYNNDRSDGNAPRGGYRGGRGGRFGNRGGAAGPSRFPKVPGVPEAVVEQRRAAGQCYRCGSADHTRFECTNASSASAAAHSSN